MDDISSQDQNQANIKASKQDVADFKVQQNNNSQKSSVNQPTPSSEQPHSQVNIIPSQEPAIKKPTPSPAAQDEMQKVRQKIKSQQVTLTPETSTRPINKPQPEEQKPKMTHDAPPQDMPAEKSQLDVKSLTGSIIKYVLIIIVAIALGYIIVNLAALTLKFDYWNITSLKNQNWGELHPIELLQAQTTAQKFDENYLYIESLGIQAPVAWGVENSDVKGMSSQGLVNYSAGALPDDATGEIYITGQTSGPIWSSSKYKTVFTLLNKINIGDKILLVYKNRIYTYQVENISSTFGTAEITPGNPNDSRLELLACYPVGIGWRTVIVDAKLIDINKNIPSSIQEKIIESGTKTELQPKEVTPTTTFSPTPSEGSAIDDTTAPQVFLPDL